jgi:hypothetical protein
VRAFVCAYVCSPTLLLLLLLYSTIAPSVASIDTLVLVSGGQAAAGPPTDGPADNVYLCVSWTCVVCLSLSCVCSDVATCRYASYANLGVDRYDTDLKVWQYMPAVLSPLLVRTTVRLGVLV